MHEDELSRKFMEVIPRSMQSLRAEYRGTARAELSTPQFRVLVNLYHGPKSCSGLARHIGVSLPSMSRMADCLVRRGYVLRAASKDDRRQVMLRLSATGQRRVAGLRAEAQARFREQFSVLDARQRKALSEGLAVLERLYGPKS